MVRLAYSLALAAAGVLSNTHAFAFIPSQPSRGLSSRHDIHSAFARPAWTSGIVQRSQRGQSFSPRYAAATLVPVEKSKALKVEFEKRFAEAQRAPQSLSESGLTALLEMACEGRMWSRALQLVTMEGVDVTPQQHRLAMQACARGECKWEAALRVLSLMEERGQAGAQDYEVAMNVCSSAQRHKDVVRILDRMDKAGVSARVSSYNAAMSALARDKQWRKALKILEYMIKQAVWPDAETYCGAMSACGQAGEWQRALILLEDMVKKGVAPSTACYNAAMEACVLGKQHERAVAFLEEMLRKDIEVDARSFAVGIAACEAGKKVDKALQLWESMLSKGVAVTSSSYGALVKVLARKQLWDQALDILQKDIPQAPQSEGVLGRGAALKVLAEEMHNNGVEWGSVSVGGSVLEGLLGCGRSRDALALVRKGAALTSGPHLHDAQALVLLSRYQSLLGASEEAARKALSVSSAPKPSPTEDPAADPEVAKISQLCAQGRVSEATALLSSQAKAQQQPLRPSLVRLVMEAAVANSDAVAAQKLLRMPGTNPGRGLYHRVLEACARAGEWQAVSVLVKEMEDDKDLPLDADSYLALMDGSRHANNLSRLQRYANKMRDAGLSFGWGHYCSLVSTYTSFGKYGLALATYRQAQAQGVSDEGEVLVKAALEAAAKGGLADDALELEGGLSAEAREGWARGLVLQALARAHRLSEVEARVNKDSDTDTQALNALLLAYKESGRGPECLSLLQSLEGRGVASEEGRAVVVQALSQDPATLTHAISTFNTIKVPSVETVEVLVSALSRCVQASPATAASSVASLMGVLQSLSVKAVAPSDTALLNVYRALPSMEGGMPKAVDKIQAMVAAAATV